MTEYELDATALVRNAERTSKTSLPILRVALVALDPWAGALTSEEERAYRAMCRALDVAA